MNFGRYNLSHNPSIESLSPGCHLLLVLLRFTVCQQPKGENIMLERRKDARRFNI